MSETETAEVTPIEPGEPFTIEYGRGHALEVVALNGRQRIQVMRVIGEVQSAASSGEFAKQADAIESLMVAVKTCCPSVTDEQLDKLDEEQMGAIVVKTLAKQQIQGEQAKKSE